MAGRVLRNLGRSYGRQEPGHQVSADSWGKQQGPGLCVGRWGGKAGQLSPALGAPCPQRWHVRGWKAAGRGMGVGGVVLEGERRAGEAEGQGLSSWPLVAKGRAVRVSHCRAEV